MRFKWEKYQSTHECLVNSQLDESALIFTGIEDGRADFHNYWMEEANKSSEYRDFCFIISDNKSPFGVIYIGVEGENLTVSELIISPEKRGMGFGSAAVKELTDNFSELTGCHISLAKAVIYPNNTASQKAFEKAGFVLSSAHTDGDAWYYVKVL